MIQIKTRRCMHCGNVTIMEVNEEAYSNWNRGMLIQNAFPDMDKEKREQLITGTHPECWNEIFAELES